ncbi:MAG: hypothetical protein VX762_00995 [Bacteroidota bacterium]|nr:hypothetical protein [Bacteroidota bacterium]
MKSKTCYLLLCAAWAAGFICLMYHTFTQNGLEPIPTLGVYALFLIAAAMGCPYCHSSCCKKE